MKTSVLAGGILLVGAAAVYYFSSGVETGSVAANAQVSAEASQVAVANHAMDVGHFLSKHDIEWIPADQAKSQAGVIIINSLDKLDPLEGAVLTQALADGQALDASKLIAKDAPEFMAAVLNPGMRAFTIEVDNVTGGAGLLRPGNRVDVILAAEMPQKLGQPIYGEPTRTAKTLLKNLRVIAVNKNLEPSGFRSEAASSDKRFVRTERSDGKGTVTLEVTPRQVEALTVARTVGELSLSLRDLHGVEIEEAAGITTTDDILPSTRDTEKHPTAKKAVVKSYFGSSSDNH